MGDMEKDVQGNNVIQRFRNNHKRVYTVVLALLACITFPLWGSLLGTLLVCLCGILCAFLAVATVGMLGITYGIIFIFQGVALAIQSSPNAWVVLGLGLILLAVGILGLLATVLLGRKTLPWLAKQTSKLLRWLFARKEGDR